MLAIAKLGTWPQSAWALIIVSYLDLGFYQIYPCPSACLPACRAHPATAVFFLHDIPSPHPLTPHQQATPGLPVIYGFLASCLACLVHMLCIKNLTLAIPTHIGQNTTCRT